MPIERRFSASPETILKDLGAVLRKMEATSARIETAGRVSQDFQRKLGRIGVTVAVADPIAFPAPGVRLSFERKGKRYPYECAKWGMLVDNLRACQRAVSSLYNVYEDYGVTGDATGQGGEQAAEASFERIMLLGGGGDDWWTVLGVKPHTPTAEIRAVYKRLAMRAHPDQGGRREEWDRLDRAYRAAMAERNERP